MVQWALLNLSHLMKPQIKLQNLCPELTIKGDLISVAGGGDTISALSSTKSDKQFSYTSTAGGAFLEWVEGKKVTSY